MEGICLLAGIAETSLVLQLYPHLTSKPSNEGMSECGMLSIP